VASSRATLPIVGPLPELVPVQVLALLVVAASSSSDLQAPMIEVIIKIDVK
tara:strand:+ start:161 stop:313 length:153 start_codon:yes stop_codon:yes gene_type:complete